VALDSAPLWGAGRVEDTFNLVAHAARLVISCAASLLDCSPQEVRRHAKLELLTERSIKASLDIDWSDEEQQKVALTRLLDEIGAVMATLASSAAFTPAASTWRIVMARCSTLPSRSMRRFTAKPEIDLIDRQSC